MGRQPMSISTRPARRSSAAPGSPARRGRAGRSGRGSRRSLVAALARLRRRRRSSAAAASDPRRATARAFAEAWARGDYAAMHALLTPEAQRRVSVERFAGAYRRAAKVATLSGLTAGRPGEPHDGVVAVPVVLRTRIFGTLVGPHRAARRRARGRRRDRLAAVPRPPRAAARRDALAHHDAAAARGDPGARRHAAGRGRGAAVRARRAGVGDRRPRRAGAARARRRARAPRRAARRAGRA